MPWFPTLAFTARDALSASSVGGALRFGILFLKFHVRMDRVRLSTDPLLRTSCMFCMSVRRMPCSGSESRSDMNTALAEHKLPTEGTGALLCKLAVIHPPNNHIELYEAGRRYDLTRALLGRQEDCIAPDQCLAPPAFYTGLQPRIPSASVLNKSQGTTFHREYNRSSTGPPLRGKHLSRTIGSCEEIWEARY